MPLEEQHPPSCLEGGVAEFGPSDTERTGAGEFLVELSEPRRETCSTSDWTEKGDPPQPHFLPPAPIKGIKGKDFFTIGVIQFPEDVIRSHIENLKDGRQLQSTQQGPFGTEDYPFLARSIWGFVPLDPEMAKSIHNH